MCDVTCSNADPAAKWQLIHISGAVKPGPDFRRSINMAYRRSIQSTRLTHHSGRAAVWGNYASGELHKVVSRVRISIEVLIYVRVFWCVVRGVNMGWSSAQCKVLYF